MTSARWMSQGHAESDVLIRLLAVRCGCLGIRPRKLRIEEAHVSRDINLFILAARSTLLEERHG
jgi:hypothetical protein